MEQPLRCQGLKKSQIKLLQLKLLDVAMVAVWEESQRALVSFALVCLSDFPTDSET